jgi:glycosyltransferase involved in cell wall biosynthesis
MRILWITTVLPDPPDNGGKIVTSQLVRCLAREGHEITLYALAGESPKRSTSTSSPLSALAEVHLFGLDSQHASPLQMTRHLFLRRPYVISKYWHEDAWRAIRRLLEDRSFDVVHLDHLHTVPYGIRARREFHIPITLTAHNVETVLWERLGCIERDPLRRTYFRRQAKRMRAYEASVLPHLDAVVVLSAADAGRVKELHPEAQVVVLAPAADLEYDRPLEAPEEPASVAFVGAMDWLPNIDGAIWFSHRVWPQVRAAIRGAKLYIVGRHPPRSIRRLAGRDVIVTGWVEDVREFVARAQVVVAPLRVGSGVRIKILNALAMGKAVVSTPIGAEGLDVIDGKHLRLADSEESFAQKVIGLLSDPVQRRHLGEAGRRLIRERYRWDQAIERLEGVYRQLANGAALHARVSAGDRRVK